jgi:hypothetical protein
VLPPPPPPLLVVEGVGLDTTGEVLWTGVVDTEELETEEPLDGLDVPVLDEDGVVLVLVLGLGFLGGACRVGTAPEPASAVMLACCELAEAAGASVPGATAGAEDFFTADPITKAATSPTTSAAASRSQRLRTSWLAGGAAIAATSLPDIKELSI